LQYRNEAVCKMYQAGNTLEQVGAAYAISRESVRQVLKRSGFTERHWGMGSARHREAEEKRQARAVKSAAFRAEVAARRELVLGFYREGVTYKEISARTGFHISYINHARRSAGLRRNRPS
jgi:DNA-binding CsgD family transcriptional regulator